MHPPAAVLLDGAHILEVLLERGHVLLLSALVGVEALPHRRGHAQEDGEGDEVNQAAQHSLLDK